MICNHDIKDLIGTSDGIKCRACGKVFASFKDLEADRKPAKKEEKPAEIIEEEKPTEEKPKKRGRKAAK